MRPFTYIKPATAADAVRAIAAAGPGARFLAGGTTLYDLMKLNVETPASIIDINSLAELAGWRRVRLVRAAVFVAQSLAVVATWPLFGYFLGMLESMGYKVGWS